MGDYSQASFLLIHAISATFWRSIRNLIKVVAKNRKLHLLESLFNDQNLYFWMNHLPHCRWNQNASSTLNWNDLIFRHVLNQLDNLKSWKIHDDISKTIKVYKCFSQTFQHWRFSWNKINPQGWLLIFDFEFRVNLWRHLVLSFYW